MSTETTDDPNPGPDETVELPTDAVDDVLEQLESAMQDGKMAMSHDEIRPSTHRLAHAVKDVYQNLVESHPGYELEEGNDS